MYPKNDISWDLDKYLGAFNFKVSINSIAQEKMKVVSINNVVSESDIVEYMLGPEPYTRKIPGKAKFSEIEITRIYQGYDSFYDWRTKIEDGVDDLRTVTVEILAPDLETTVRKMILHNCWPHKWQLPNLDASSTAPAIETIVLACERVTQSLSDALAPVLASTGADANAGQGTGPIAAGNAEGTALENIDADDSFWDQESDLTALEDQYNAALALAAPTDLGPLAETTATGDTQIFADTTADDGIPLDPNVETWATPEAADDPTAARNGGDGTGALDPNEETWDAPESGDGITDNNKNNDREAQDESEGLGPIGGRGEQEELDSGTGDGPKGGRGDQDEADYGTPSDGTLDPNEETWDAPESGDGITDNLKRGAAAGTADGTGPTIKGTAEGKSQEFSDTGGGTGPVDPNEETWDAPEGGDETKNFRDNDDTKFEGEPTEWADTSDDGAPIDPNEETWDAPDAVDDPTAARNGGDGSGPIGGRGEQAEADYGEGSGPIGGRGDQAAADYGAGSGPIDNEAVDYGGSAAADDPTAARNGGDGSGPIGGRGAQAEADYGSPGDGPKGGRGYTDDE